MVSPKLESILQNLGKSRFSRGFSTPPRGHLKEQFSSGLCLQSKGTVTHIPSPKCSLSSDPPLPTPELWSLGQLGSALGQCPVFLPLQMWLWRQVPRDKVLILLRVGIVSMAFPLSGPQFSHLQNGSILPCPISRVTGVSRGMAAEAGEIKMFCCFALVLCHLSPKNGG